MTLDAIRPASYVLIVDTDADRIAAAVRGCGDALPMPTLVARNGDDAIRILQQFGPPAVLMAALTLPDRDGFAVIESLRRIDDNAAVIAWAGDRELREYAANWLAGTRAKVLGRALSPAVCQRCVQTLCGDDARLVPTVSSVDRCEENWLDLAESARRRLRVAGAAAYTKVCGASEYRWSVSWRPDAPMPDFPMILPSALEEVMATGAARMWTDLVNDSMSGSSGAPSLVALRTVAVVPILRDGEIAGALCVFDSEPDALRHDDLETLSAIAARSPARHTGPASPMDRNGADAIIKRELARVNGDQPTSVILFAVTARRTNDLSTAGDVLASAVRGNDLVIRWTTSEVLVVLVGVCCDVAARVAERIRGAVERRAANRIAVSGDVTKLRATDSFEEVIAKAAERLQNTAQDGRPRIA